MNEEKITAFLTLLTTLIGLLLKFIPSLFDFLAL
jgi:hypothetical protein